MAQPMSAQNKKALELLLASQKASSSNTGQQKNNTITSNTTALSAPVQTTSLHRKNNKYADLNTLELDAAKNASIWKDEDFYKVRVYRVTRLTADEACVMGKAVKKALNTGKITSDIVFMCLFLAVSVRRTAEVEKHLLVDINHLMKNVAVCTQPTAEAENEEDDEDDQSSRQLELIRRAKNLRMGTAAVKTDEEVGKLKNEPEKDKKEDNKDFAAAAYSYLAAFLMRLQCREPTTVLRTLETARNRFQGFYDEGRDTLEDIEPSLEALQQIRDILARRPEITSTWVAWVSYAENEAVLGRQDRGLLEYLALQVFAYQGMHVVVQILTIQQLTQHPIGDLLRQLDCRMTRSAVQEVYRILRDYHRNGQNPNRKTYFRYARVWDDGYFTRVQSKNCASLLYLAARTVKNISNNATSDPTQIYVVKNMGESMQAFLDEVSAQLVKEIHLKNLDDEETGDIWKLAAK